MPDLPIVDRLLRGRAWIPLLGVMLAGIVAMQVELLKLNSSIGRAIDRSTALQSRNEQLRASVATLADDQRIERLAARMGMVMPTPESVVFLAPRSSDVQQAVAHIRAPDASVFAALQPTASTNLPITPSSTTTSTTSSGSTSGSGYSSSAATPASSTASATSGGAAASTTGAATAGAATTSSGGAPTSSQSTSAGG